MSEYSQSNSTNKQLFTKYNRAKLAIRNIRTVKGSYENTSGDDETYLAGTVFGRIAATGKIIPLEPSASDGSQLPVGILLEDTTVADAATVDLTLINQGDVAEELVVFADAYTTVDDDVDGQIIRDRLQYLGVRLIAGTELTKYDNE
jgi:hypothetical protein